MDSKALAARAPIGALKDVETFIQVAGRCKALVIELAERRARESRYQRTLAQQIQLFKNQCEQLAHDNARIREMWRQTLAELEPLEDKSP
jgi:hypothetical protein